MLSNHSYLQERVIKERKNGKTFSEIRAILKSDIPKSTLSYWCRNVSLPDYYKDKICKIVKESGERGRLIAVAVNKAKREKYLSSLFQKNRYLLDKLKNKDVAKIALSLLYAAEGSKGKRGSLSFANSDPKIISIFLVLLRFCFKFYEDSFRCTLQCRADQNIKKLKHFWSKVTNIPQNKFYKARVDKRTIGKPTKKKKYPGVCKIDLLNAGIYNEIDAIIRVLNATYRGPMV